MKKLLSFFIILAFVFFLAPIHCYANETAQYTFHTYIDGWYKEDELIYHCSPSYGTDHFIFISAGDERYHYDSCEDIVVNEILDGFNDSNDYIQDISIAETVIVTDIDQDTVVLSSPYLELTDSDYDGTPVIEHFFRDYHPGDYTVDIAALKEKDPNYLESQYPMYDSELCNIRLGTVWEPLLFVSFQFVVRGDLADPSGEFLFLLPDSSDALSFSNGDTFEAYNDGASLLSLTELKSFLETKPEVAYTGVYNEQDYSVAFHLLDGEGLQAVHADPEELIIDESIAKWGLYFEVEARNDSEIANTGLLYDMGPYLILTGVFIGFLLVFKRHKIKEDNEELH